MQKLKKVEMSDAEEQGTICLRSFELPPSGLLDAAAREELNRRARHYEVLSKLYPNRESILSDADAAIAFRQFNAEHHDQQLAARHKARYAVNIEPKMVTGVYTEVFTPKQGIAAGNRQRVLINLHGGGFVIGARWIGQVESIPIAAVGQIKVISIDYRMAPEHRFPAASEDVANVYSALLDSYRPENIGIYGCSAGALLTAQTVAWLQNARLPRPGAVCMLGAAGAYWGEGDSGHFHAARMGWPLIRMAEPRENLYFKETDPSDSLAFPLRSPQRLAQFPPSLLISATRDLALSSVVHTHCRLVELGVKADLQVWEGLDHAFHYWPDLPQSQEVYKVVARFFDERLSQ